MIIANIGSKKDVSWIRDLKISDNEKEHLPWHVAQMIEAIGLDATVDVLKLLGGLNVHMPKPSSAFAWFRNKAILEQFDGSNYRELARDFGITEKHLKDLLRAARRNGEVETGKNTASRLECELNGIKR